jgi:hypothetical protein
MVLPTDSSSCTKLLQANKNKGVISTFFFKTVTIKIHKAKMLGYMK